MFIIYWQRYPPQLAHISQNTKTHTNTLLFVNIPEWVDLKQSHFFFSVKESKEAKLGIPRYQRKSKTKNNDICFRSYRGSRLLLELEIKA